MASSGPPSSHPPSDLHLHLFRLKNLLSCSICHGVLERPACLPCNHHFCMSCLLHSMKEISACPKCKQMATLRQAKLSPDVNDIVDVYRKLEEASVGSCLSEVTNLKDSRTQFHAVVKKQSYTDEKGMGFHANTENACMSPTEVKRQGWNEMIKSPSDRSLNTTELGSKKRSLPSGGVPCRGILPAPKRIHLPYPPLPSDMHDPHLLEKKHKALGNDSALANDIDANEIDQRKCNSGLVGVQAKMEDSPMLSSKNNVQMLEEDCVVEQHESHGGVEQSCLLACMGSQAEGQETAQSEEYTRERLAASSGITGPSARIDSKLSKLKLDKLNSNDSSPQVSKAGADGTSMIQCGDGNDTPVPKVGDSNAECGTCAFCHKSDSLVAGSMIHYKKPIVVNLGGKKTGQISCVHKNCAEWAPGVYYEDEVAKNVPQEVVRGHKIKCNVCGLRGAVLGCYVKRCRKSFHYPCAQTLPCRWDLGNFLVLCPEHSGSKFPDEGLKGFKSCFSNNIESAVVESDRNNACVANEYNPCSYVPNAKTVTHDQITLSSDVYVPTMEASTPNEQQSPQCEYMPKVYVPAMETSTLNKKIIHCEIQPEAYVPTTEAPALCSVKIEATMEEHPVKWPTSKWVLCASGLNPKTNELLATFVRRTGVIVERMWSPRVTHLICGTDEMGAARRTFKYLMANLEGKWILKVDWLSACLTASKYVNEEPYEVSKDVHGMIGGPRHARGMAFAKAYRLFEGLRFYFMGSFISSYQADLEALLKAGGGEILSIIPDAMDMECGETDIIVYSKDVSNDEMRYRDEVIKARYVEAKSYAGIVGSKVVSHIWILDSVAAYELQPFE